MKKKTVWSNNNNITIILYKILFHNVRAATMTSHCSSERNPLEWNAITLFITKEIKKTSVKEVHSYPILAKKNVKRKWNNLHYTYSSRNQYPVLQFRNRATLCHLNDTTANAVMKIKMVSLMREIYVLKMPTLWFLSSMVGY